MKNSNEVIISMLEELISANKHNKQQRIDVAQIESLTNDMHTELGRTEDMNRQLGEVIEKAKQPVTAVRKVVFRFESPHTIAMLLMNALTVIALAIGFYDARKEAERCTDNDLKYRYVAMQGEASPELIEALDNIFRLPDKEQIEYIRRTVSEYETTIRKQVALEEQSRRKAQEAARLDDKATRLKNGK